MAAGGLNKAMLIGHVLNEPKTNVTKGGARQAYFVLATTEEWFDKATDQRRTKTVTHRIVVYGPLVNVVEKCVHQGARVYVEGGIETRRWVAKDGTPTDSWVTEIVVQGWSGRITVLDFSGGAPARATTPEGAEDDSPPPFSVKRSAAKYSDGLGADTDTSGLERFLSPDDHDRARLRSASDDRRNSQ